MNAPQRAGLQVQTKISMTKMFIVGFDAGGGDLNVIGFLKDSNDTLTGTYGATFQPAIGDNKAQVKVKAEAALVQYLTDASISLPDSTEWIVDDFAPAGLANAPQAAIANAPADAVTNYNTVTTLLGGLTGAVNTANSKQNDIATKLNALLTELRTLGLISS